MITVAAWILAGVALWLTRSVLDMFGDATHSTRVAMLPSAPELAGLIVVSLLGGCAVAGVVKRWTRDAAEASDARLQIALPLVELAVIGLPFLPLLPDIVLPLRAFAGPIVWIIWFAIAGLVVMTASAVRARLIGRRSATVGRATAATIIFLATIAIGGTAGYMLRDSVTYPGGDEPHYMIVMQSLWQDHDLEIQNNYDTRADAESFALLTPDGTPGTNGALYPARGVGLAVLGAPMLAWAGYHGLIWMFVFLTAISALVMWTWVVDHTGSNEAASMAWLAIFMGAPVLLTSIAVYPDIPAALCVLMAVAWRSSPGRRSPVTPAEYACRAVAIAALPWLSMTYAPLAAALVIVLGLRAGANRKAVVMLLTIFTLSLAAWFGFFHAIWGRWSPMAALGTRSSFGNPLRGSLGLLFDQEFGVLAYAPAVILGFSGLIRMAASNDDMTRMRARELAILFAVLLISVGALSMWWGGAAPPGRPLVPALPLLGLPIAWTYQRASESPTRRAAYQLLVFIGVAFSLLMIFGQDGGLVAQDRDGSSRLLQWLTSLWPAWEAVPSVAAFGLRQSAPLIALWIVTATAVASALDRSRIRSTGVAGLAASTTLAVAAIFIAMLGPVVAKPASAWVLQPESRSRVPMLDSFDRAARPHAIVYNRFTLTSADGIPPLMTLAASPGQRPGGQPVRVLLNARYALAAGEYEIEIGGIPGVENTQGTVALQIGRMGSPYFEWDASIPPGGTWRQRFALPVDAEFVGFMTTPAIEHATSLRIRPISTVDKSRREANVHGLSFNVLAAVAFPAASMFFHDEDVYPEPTGVWVHGESTTLMTVAPRNPERGVTLRVHSGARPNAATFSTTTWGQRIELTPGSPQEVQIPPPAKPGPFLLRVQTERSFVPAETMAGSTDRRILGIWIEIPE